MTSLTPEVVEKRMFIHGWHCFQWAFVVVIAMSENLVLRWDGFRTFVYSKLIDTVLESKFYELDVGRSVEEPK